MKYLKNFGKEIKSLNMKVTKITKQAEEPKSEIGLVLGGGEAQRFPSHVRRRRKKLSALE